MAAAPSSSAVASFYGIRGEDQLIQLQQQQMSSKPSSLTAAPPQAAQKKRRNLPGTPYPDAEVIALSPKTLMATNRFICEVCNKGFQREQNLQLHRRGHNLPWKLKQKNPKEARRRVYLCPEPTCAHHDPSRALGDLTGIKKHFSRKHGEKKWKCDKCAKRYAVQSDWKAHSKVCGTREYRCGCGTLFSRRDSFITHRAFCDALAQESSRIPDMNPIGSQLYGSNSMALGLSQFNSQMSSLQEQSQASADLLRLNGGGGARFDHLNSSMNSSLTFFHGGSNQDYNEDNRSHHSLLQPKPYHGLLQLPNLQCNPDAPPSAASNLFNLSFFTNGNTSSNMSNSSNAGNQSSHLMLQDQFNNGKGPAEPETLILGNHMTNQSRGGGASSLYHEQALPQMSATALLQKAAQMGATTSSNNGASLLRGYRSSSPIGLKPSGFRDIFGEGHGGHNLRSQMEKESNIHELMNSLSNGNNGVFGGAGGEQEVAFGRFGQGLRGINEEKMQQGLTRDFLGVGSMVAAMGRGISQRELQHSVDIGSFAGEMKSPASGRSFNSGDLQ